MKVTAPPTTAVRPLHEILAAVRMANCGECWQHPGTPCAQGPDGADGYHVARLARAFRRGLISGTDLVAALQAVLVFTTATVIWDTAGSAGRDVAADDDADEACPRWGAISWGMTPDGMRECTRCLWPEPAVTR